MEFYWVALHLPRVGGFGTFSWMLSSPNLLDWSCHESHASPERMAHQNESLSRGLLLSHRKKEKKKNRVKYRKILFAFPKILFKFITIIFVL